MHPDASTPQAPSELTVLTGTAYLYLRHGQWVIVMGGGEYERGYACGGRCGGAYTDDHTPHTHHSCNLQPQNQATPT